MFVISTLNNKQKKMWKNGKPYFKNIAVGTPRYF